MLSAKTLVACVAIVGNVFDTAGAAPFVPQSPNEIVVELTPPTGSEWDEIHLLRAELAAEPSASAIAARLAHSYLELFRVEGDPRLIGYAAAALSQWTLDGTAPPAVALELIAIEQLEHRFDTAMRALEDFLARHASDAQAWLMRASISLARGQYPESTSACTRLVFTAGAETAGACLAAVQAVTGQARQAREFLAAAFARGDYAADAAFESWVRTLAAETAVALALPSDADVEFRTALSAARRDGGRPTLYLVSAYADFLLDSGRNADVLTFLTDAPPSDATLLRAATARKRLGLVVDDEIRTLSQHLELTLSGYEQTHAREAAYFLLRVLDAPTDALALAARNFAMQREPLDARLVLEAAVAICDGAAALPVLDWMQINAVEHATLVRLRDSLRDCR
jgi:hypothetical protein